MLDDGGKTVEDGASGEPRESVVGAEVRQHWESSEGRGSFEEVATS